MLANKYLRLAVLHVILLTVALLASCAPAVGQTLDSAHVFPRVVTFTDSVTALDSVKWYTRVPPPVHDTTVVHDTLPVVHDTLPVVHDTTWRTVSTLRGARMPLPMGAAVKRVPFEADSLYRNTLAATYDVLVGEDENSVKFGVLHPSQATYTYTKQDALVAFAQAHGQTVHGAVLVRLSSNPAWLTGGNFTKPQLLQILKDHLTTVVTHFKGKITSYDVVNEAISWNGATGYEVGIWQNVIGPEYIDSSFVWTHRADSTAKLYLNDYATELYPAKADFLYTLATGMRARGVPIDGIGFQTHLLTPPASAAALQAVFARFAAAGFDVRVSELDQRVPNTNGSLTVQAVAYRDALDACLKSGRCAGVTTWGVTDRYSWIPGSFPTYGRALPFDSAYHPKPAYDSLVARLQRVP